MPTLDIIIPNAARSLLLVPIIIACGRHSVPPSPLHTSTPQFFLLLGYSKDPPRSSLAVSLSSTTKLFFNLVPVLRSIPLEATAFKATIIQSFRISTPLLQVQHRCNSSAIMSASDESRSRGQQPMLASQRAKDQTSAPSEANRTGKFGGYFPLGYREAVSQWVRIRNKYIRALNY